MHLRDTKQTPPLRAVVIGAGFGGLSAALLLRAQGHRVTLIETHDWVGGKARTIPSPAGPIDAGPTVLTMRPVFDALFAATGAKLEDYATVTAEPLLARHFWPDGSQLDLFADRDKSADAVARFAGEREARAFRTFCEDAQALFDLFEEPMMHAADPSVRDLTQTVLSRPRHLRSLAPLATLAAKLRRRFRDPRLRQLFGRYATYVGGSPFHAPALLALIWRAEEAGVWLVKGGVQTLAKGMAKRFRDMGGEIILGTGVVDISTTGGRVSGVVLKDGSRHDADAVVFNGDPRALALGYLGDAVRAAAPQTLRTPRSLSARVWAFAARPFGPDLAHHNVFFGKTPRAEFDALRADTMPQDPTIYVCAQDRNSHNTPPETERFEIILNAPALTNSVNDPKEFDRCRQVTFRTLARFGLTFDPEPARLSLATPMTFETLFPGSGGALYGQSPHGVTAALKRPRARTPIRGLYLSGGGTHPGAGVPMAALSGRHAAAAIETDLIST